MFARAFENITYYGFHQANMLPRERDDDDNIYIYIY